MSFGSNNTGDGNAGQSPPDHKQADELHPGHAGFAAQSNGPNPDEACILLPGSPSRGRLRRWLTYLGVPLVGLAGLAGAGYLYLDHRLASGPMELPRLGAQIASALSQRAGKGYHVQIGRALLQKERGRPSIIIDKVSLTGNNNAVILSAPKAVVSLDWLALLSGSVQPKRLAVAGLDLHVTIAADGQIGISAGDAVVAIKPKAGLEKKQSPEPQSIGAGGDDQPGTDPGKLAVQYLDSLFRQLANEQSLTSLRQIGITGGRLILTDQMRGRNTVFGGLEMNVSRSRGNVSAKVSANGARGRWHLTGSAAKGDGYAITLKAENLGLNEIILACGQRHLPVDFDNPLGGRLRFTLGKSGKINSGEGSFESGAGLFVLSDGDFEPAFVDNVRSSFRWDAATKKLFIDSLIYKSGKTELTFKGSVAPPGPQAAGWRIALETSGAAYAAHQMKDAESVKLDQLSLAVIFEPDQQLVRIEKVSLASKAVNLLVSGRYDFAAGRKRMRLVGQMDRAPVDAVLSLWPSYFAPPARSWFRNNVSGGWLERLQIRLNMGEEALSANARHAPLPAGSSDISYALSGTTLRYLPGVRPLSGVVASGQTLGSVSNVTISRAQARLESGGLMQLSAGKLRLQDLGRNQTAAALQFRLAGSLAHLEEMLGQSGFARYKPGDLDLERMKGKIDGSFDLAFTVGQDVTKNRLKLSGKARLSSLRIDKFAGPAHLEDGRLDVALHNGSLVAKGTGTLFSTKAQLKISKPVNRPASGSINFVLDDKARAKLGWQAGKLVTGPIKVAINGALSGGKGKVPQARVSVDLTRAAIKKVAPGLAKPAGETARAEFKLAQTRGGVQLNDFVFRSPALTARGTVSLNDNHEFTSARLSQLKLSPGDDLRADIRSTEGMMRVNISGPAVDLRPFLTSNEKSGAGSKSGKLQLNVNTRIATGFNGQVLSALKLNLEKNGESITGFSLRAKAGRASVNGRLLQRGQKGPRIEITSNDGGTVLSFLNVYKRMQGGRLRMQAELTSSAIIGVLDVRKFLLRDEKAIRQLVARSSRQTADGAARRIDPSAVAFERLQFGFHRTNKVLVIREGILNGPDIGLTLSGFIDSNRDRVSMKGTFVPAYELNNAFARIPLFGPFLGGGRNEGLLGVNFRVSGRVAQPVLTINPLSAIAPGFLRKIFGVLPPQQPRR